VLPSAEIAAMVFWALLASGQISMRWAGHVHCDRRGCRPGAVGDRQHGGGHASRQGYLAGRAGDRLRIRPGQQQSRRAATGDGRVLFTATDGVHGVEPWISDDTAAGTQMLADLAGLPGVGSGAGSFILL
jgi:ELWxxDGT repeat protein